MLSDAATPSITSRSQRMRRPTTTVETRNAGRERSTRSSRISLPHSTCACPRTRQRSGPASSSTSRSRAIGRQRNRVEPIVVRPGERDSMMSGSSTQIRASGLCHRRGHSPRRTRTLRRARHRHHAPRRARRGREPRSRRRDVPAHLWALACTRASWMFSPRPSHPTVIRRPEPRDGRSPPIRARTGFRASEPDHKAGFGQLLILLAGTGWSPPTHCADRRVSCSRLSTYRTILVKRAPIWREACAGLGALRLENRSDAAAHSVRGC